MKRPSSILVSACLLGQPVRYDGQAKTLADATLERWRAEGRLVPFCPEVAGGLAVPRPAAEIREARILTGDGHDVTAAFHTGAAATLAAATAAGCRFALLTDGSPSCGSTIIHDGSFTRTRIAGAGVTAALLRAHGIRVFAHDQIEALAALLAQEEASA